MELHERLPGSRLIIVPEGTHSDLDKFEPHFADVDTFLKDALLPGAPEKA